MFFIELSIYYLGFRSGKTLGYILPAIMHILHRKLTIKCEANPIALVLAPTRELAQQIQQVVTEFGAPSNIRSICLCGGVAKVYQLADINKGCDIIIGTPGRLIDLLDDKSVNLRQCSYVVLDEGKFPNERMLTNPRVKQFFVHSRSYVRNGFRATNSSNRISDSSE